MTGEIVTQKGRIMMKKKAIVLLMTGMVLVAGCGNAKTQEDSPAKESTQSQERENTQDTLQQTEAEEQTKIEPAAETIDINNLDNATFAASFAKEDLDESDGAFKITFTVYDYERFQADDINALKAGDVIVVDGNETTVTDVSVAGTCVSVNGGIEQDGYDFYLGEDGFYFEGSMDDAKMYQEIGTVTFPVAQEFLLTDNSDLDNQGKTYYPGDLLTDFDAVGGSFVANNTTVTTQDGKVVSIVRNYMP